MKIDLKTRGTLVRLMLGLILCVWPAFPSAAEESHGECVVTSVRVLGASVAVDLARADGVGGRVRVVVTATVGSKPIIASQEVTVEGQGSTTAILDFDAPVSGVLTVGLTEGSEPM